MSKRAPSKPFVSNTDRLFERQPDLRPMMMPYLRGVKPEYFTHEIVASLTPLARLAWIGLWQQSDKHGVFAWRPKTLKLKILPYDAVDFEEVLQELLCAALIGKFESGGETYGYTPTWAKHQAISNHERKSRLEYPLPPKQEWNVPERAGTCWNDSIEVKVEGLSPSKNEESEIYEPSLLPRDSDSDESPLGSNENVELTPQNQQPPQETRTQIVDEADVKHLSGVCYEVLGQTPVPEDVRRLLEQYSVFELEAALREYASLLDTEDRSFSYAEFKFFVKGGAAAVITSRRERNEPVPKPAKSSVTRPGDIEISVSPEALAALKNLKKVSTQTGTPVTELLQRAAATELDKSVESAVVPVLPVAELSKPEPVAESKPKPIVIKPGMDFAAELARSRRG
jgi:hypothetical protein